MFPISYRDLALMLLDRGVSVVLNASASPRMQCFQSPEAEGILVAFDLVQ